MTANFDNPKYTLASRYEIREDIGIGSMGIVHKAFDHLSKRHVALKRMLLPAELLGFIDRPDRLHMLFSLAREFKTLASLNHPYIVSVLDFGFEDNQQPYLVMEYIESQQTITAYLQGASDERKLQLLIQVLQALAYLHSCGVIHHDVKPDNVLIAEDKVKLIDFGLAALPTDETTDIQGTLTHISPEVLRGDAVTPAADLYAVGVLAHQLFTGELVFYAGDVAEMRRQILEDAPNFHGITCPPEFLPVLERLLRKDPADRYSDAQSVVRDIEERCGITAEETITLRESYLQAAKFVGREAELDQLMDALMQTHRHQGSAWLIAGEAGIGKSRLLEEFRIRALVEGIPVVRGNERHQGNLPYQFWRDIVRRLLLLTGISNFEARILKEIVPDIGDLLQFPVQDAPQLPDEAAQERLTLTLSHLLRRHDEPLLVLIEDLHWAQESLIPLRRLISMIDHTPLMLVATYRPEDAPYLPDDIGDMNSIQTIQLAPLSREEIQELSTTMLGKQSPRTVDLLSRETEGNPYFLVEIMRELAEQSGSLAEIPHTPLPDDILTSGIEQVMQRRLSYLTDEQHDLLKFVAVMGRQLDLTLFVHYVPDMQRIENWLFQCANVGLLTLQEGEWLFAHQKVMNVVQHTMSADDTAYYHRVAAELISSVYAGDDNYVPLLAEHWYHAGNRQRALDYAWQAGQQVLRRNNLDEALMYARRGRELFSTDTEPVWFIRLRILFGDIYERLGEYRKATRHYRKALRHEALPYHPLEAIDVYTGLGTIALRRANYDAMDIAFTHVVTLAQQIDDVQALTNGLVQRGVAAYQRDDYVTAQDALHKSLHLSLADDNPLLIAASKMHLGYISHVEGDYAQARDYYSDALDLYERVGDTRSVAMVHRYYGMLLESDGDPSAALAHYTDGVTIAKNLSDLWLTAEILCDVTFMHSQAGDVAQAWDDLQEVVATAAPIDSPLIKQLVLLTAAHVFLRSDDVHRAADLLSVLMDAAAFDERLRQQRLLPLREAVRASLGADDWQAHLAQGREMTLDEMANQLIAEMI